jgi:anthranilate 1,2-dioxygenase small subunit
MNATVFTSASADPIPAATRDAIARLMMEYVHVIDNNELERWPPLFTEQCLYQIIPRVEYDQGRKIGVWVCDNRGMLEDRVSSIREVNVFEPHVYRHVIGPTEILHSAGNDSGAYQTQTSYIVVRTMHDGEMVVFSAGRYVDEVVIENNTARFRQRIVVTDSWRYDTLIAIPI